MSHQSIRRVSRWTLALTSIASAVLVAGMATANAAPGSPAPSPSPNSPSPGVSAPSPAPSASLNARGAAKPAACTVGPNGRLANCPKPVPRSKMPAGAKKTTIVQQPVSDIAQMVDTRTWTSGGGNTFPGADVPFGMTQWSPDTMPNRAAGGGYTFGDTSITGYSLTHISGPGCGAAEDIPMLPMTGPMPSGNLNTVTTSFSNDNEVAQAGYYSAQSNQPNTITSNFTATPHTSMGQFTYPSGTQADFLIKLRDAQNGEFAPSTAKIVGNDEITGSETSGHFCGESNNDGQQQVYTVHFDIVFDHPFATSQILTGSSGPSSVFLTFDTSSNQTIQAKVGTSYVSDANAQLDVQTENPGWDFNSVKSTAQQDWNNLLSEIQISGGDFAETQEFYSVLYKDFMQPNISSDVNGQYMGADMQVHTVSGQQKDQYGTYSGWDIYHSLSQLQAMLDPTAASDQAQSLVNYYEQDHILQQWGYLNLNNYVMVGDPAQSIIADYYAFGARNFNTSQALTDMLKQATTVNDVRPGEALEQQYGYLPSDASYGCCNPHGVVATELEYDTEDLALSQFASALGDSKDASMLEQRANNWENMFDPNNNLLNPRTKNGAFVPGIVPTFGDNSELYYVEGDAYEYLWNTPNNYPALFSLMGGNAKVAPVIRQYLSQPNGFGMFAQLSNEFDFGEQYMGDYDGDPATTQAVVHNMINTMQAPGPSGLPNNDDLGANSSTLVWEMLGMYPENSGTDNLVFSGAHFPHAAISLPNGKTITINAPAASQTNYYVQNLKLNGSPYEKLYVPFSTLSNGATLDWTLGSRPSTWGNAPQDAPPSYGAGTRPAVGFASDSQVTVAPGGSTTVTIGAQNATTSNQKVQASISAPPSGLSVSPANATLNLAPNGRSTTKITISASASAQQTFYTVPISLSDAGASLPKVTLSVLVAPPGSLLRAFNNAGVSDDTNGGGNFDGGGFSYSAQALAAQGVTPGSTVQAGDISYTWPLSQPGEPDNAITEGQQVTVNAPAGTQQLGFLGSASGGNTQGLMTLTYSDGSTARYWLGFSDWTLGGGGGSVAFGNVDAVTTDYRDCDCTGGRDNVKTHVFSAVIPVDPSKTLSSVTLPSGTTGGELHVFAIGTSTAAQNGPVVTSVGPGPAHAGDVETIHGSGFGATQGNGFVAFSDNNINWGRPGNAATFQIDSWSDTAITFTVPTPSGANGQFHVAPGTTAMVSVQNDAGQMSDTAALDIAPSANLADYYDNTGISNDGDATCNADFDGDGYSYSAQALAQAGANPGGTVTVDGLNYTWPNVPACQPDNILAAGQKILVNGAAGATKLGFLGSSGNGSAQGPLTVNYTDGTSQTSTLFFGDWAQSPQNGNITALTMPYRNHQGGSNQQITMMVFAEEIPLDSSKTVASITLPMIADHVSSNASTHIFAITTGS